MHRLFIAIRPPDAVIDTLIDIEDEGFPLRWQDEAQIHLTLRFIGEVERPLAEDLALALERLRFPAFTLRIKGLGRFDARRGGVLWAGVEPREEVRALAAKIERLCQEVGLPPERRAFHPHITLARWSGRAPDLQPLLERHSALAGDPWRVERVLLFESHLLRSGAHYEEVASFPADQAPALDSGARL